jgi:hypothetical protein
MADGDTFPDVFSALREEWIPVMVFCLIAKIFCMVPIAAYTRGPCIVVNNKGICDKAEPQTGMNLHAA